MSAREFAARFGLHRAGHEWRGTCPACGYANSFALTDGKHGPVGWCASCGNQDAIAQALGHSQSAPTPRAQEKAERTSRERLEHAERLWRGSIPVLGTAAATYLHARGIGHLVDCTELRFHPSCPHPSSALEHPVRLPALIAAVRDAGGALTGVHRTYVRRDGSAKADIEPTKASLGQIRGGAVRLASLDQVLAAGELVVGEGVETSASAGLLLGLPAWAAVSAGNLARGIVLPRSIRRVLIAADRDPAGQDAARAAVSKFRREGRAVRKATPNEGRGDFNDIKLTRGRRRMSEAHDAPEIGANGAQVETPEPQNTAKARPNRKRGKTTSAPKGNGAAATTPSAKAEPQSEDEAIQQAAQLSRRGYAEVRAAWAKRFGFIRVGEFDAAVEQARERAKKKAAAEASAKAGFTIDDEPDGEGEREKRTGSQRDRLLEVALTAGITFWRDEDGNAFATVERDGRIERYRVRFAAFKQLLRLLYGERHPNKKATATTGQLLPGGVSDTAMNEALPTLEAIAQRGKTRMPAVRVCGDDQGTIWIDLGDQSWSLIAVDASGWRIVAAADVPLIRTKGMRALPMPVRDPGALGKLRQLLNLNPDPQATEAARSRVDDFFKLIVSFMLCVLWPRGPYPILAVNGEQGSAKTTGCRIIRTLTDPNQVPIRHAPRNPDDLFVTAKNSRLPVVDNVSHVTAELGDVFCGIATGSGIGKRLLYSDDEEAIIGACNPLIISGIEELVTRGDLADRSLTVMFTAISDENRREEAEMEATLAEAAPGILALLLDALAEAMRNLPTLKLSRLPRMADFTRLACAAAQAFGWTADEVFEAITTNREAATEVVLAADPVAAALLDFMDRRAPDLTGARVWSGTATELLKELRKAVPEDTAKSRSWPKTPHNLSGKLRRAQPALRRNDVLLSMGRDEKKRQRTILIQRAAKPADEGQSASPASSDSGSNGLAMTQGVTLPLHEAPPDAGEARAPLTPNAATADAASPEDNEQDLDDIEENRFAGPADRGAAEWSPAAAMSGEPADDSEGEL